MCPASQPINETHESCAQKHILFYDKDFVTIEIRASLLANSDMSIAFWSATVKVGTPLEVQPPEGYVLNLQQAALVCENDNAKGSMQVICHTTAIEGDALTSVLGTLRPNSQDQFAMALVFGYDVPVKFSVEGSLKGGVVHLSGYYQPGPDDDDEDDDEMEGMYDMDDDEEDDDEEDGNGPQYRKLLAAKGGDDNDDDDEDDDKIVVEGLRPNRGHLPQDQDGQASSRCRRRKRRGRR